jgi:hypothetical protein
LHSAHRWMLESVKNMRTVCWGVKPQNCALDLLLVISNLVITLVAFTYFSVWYILNFYPFYHSLVHSVTAIHLYSVCGGVHKLLTNVVSPAFSNTLSNLLIPQFFKAKHAV